MPERIEPMLPEYARLAQADRERREAAAFRATVERWPDLTLRRIDHPDGPFWLCSAADWTRRFSDPLDAVEAAVREVQGNADQC